MVGLAHADEVYPDPLVEPTVGRPVVGLVGVDPTTRHEFLHRAKGEGFKLSGVRGLPVGGIAIFRVGRPPWLSPSREKHQVAPQFLALDNLSGKVCSCHGLSSRTTRAASARSCLQNAAHVNTSQYVSPHRQTAREVIK